jgi:DNA mismatch repair protein MutS
MWMRHRLLAIYTSIVEEMSSKYTFYVPVATLVAKVDLVHSYSKVSFRYNYHRPEMVPSEKGDENSFIQAKEIRHPIIERIIDGAYVTNDIALGSNVNKKESQTNGMCLFGLNSSGKSSLAKAIGLNVVMAQAGCYTPSKMSYRPYKKIITRLSGNDNLFKGKSSFEVEMEELRTILRQADANTLVIGDELTRGSETNSGMAITSSTLLHLIERKSSFLFATHMHELLKLSFIRNIPEDVLKICHLSVKYDEEIDSLIYDRKLNDGSGSSLYGLMVAKSLGLPKEFIDRANEMLLEITGQNKNIVEPKRSRYNGKVYVDSCSLCNKTKAETELQTHHIIEQSKAIDNIVQKIEIISGDNVSVGKMHKNSKDNLIVLCRDCHTNLHSQGMELETLTVPHGKIIRMRPDVPMSSVA